MLAANTESHKVCITLLSTWLGHEDGANLDSSGFVAMAAAHGGQSLTVLANTTSVTSGQCKTTEAQILELQLAFKPSVSSVNASAPCLSSGQAQKLMSASLKESIDSALAMVMAGTAHSPLIPTSSENISSELAVLVVPKTNAEDNIHHTAPSSNQLQCGIIGNYFE
eukprot:6394665-Amphidinium_carterae.1